MPVGPLITQGLIEPDEGITLSNTKIEWYSVKDASICITIHIEAFFIHNFNTTFIGGGACGDFIRAG